MVLTLIEKYTFFFVFEIFEPLCYPSADFIQKHLAIKEIPFHNL